jgi:Bifunctional DNA primase/polymerase, N-terminal
VNQYNSSSGSSDSVCQNTLKTALWLASKHILVFPLVYGTKFPEPGSRGFKDATDNPSIIERWFGDNYRRNLGVRTGAVSGIFALDFDSLEALEDFQAFFGPLPPTLQSNTGRGRHFLLKWPLLPLQNTVGKIWPHVDSRCDGGYIAVPPSLHPNGDHYKWANSRETPILEAPSWLLAGLRKPTAPDIPRRRQGEPQAAAGRPGSYGETALRREIAALAAMLPDTARNSALNRVAFSMAQLAAGGEVNWADVEQALIGACIKNGLAKEDGLASVMATIRSGAAAGRLYPRDRNGRNRP